ncbi:hypothetical protein FH609_018090 [Streptomyces sp. 3MP-14]|uniref:Uncharacterized protein n=1 Tax=Streptomyces mimosae TaxID=2586635 RepID=A0A5N6A9X1_9ACTN|nr:MULTISPECIES: hypothetical protein [Streptomyces]KAB8164629.1 hypothetical protein FH607_015415 [Streptomyces mimosae]KAB8175545.1 hypothetical protein FH609_018090 [Streptomyces sp. 3MP-14]
MSATLARLVTFVELNAGHSTARQLSVDARLEAELSDGRRVVLLDDRGWTMSAGGADVRAFLTVEDIEADARTVVGPDEPVEGETHAEMAAAHWGALAALLARQGVTVSGPQLERARHDVELSPRLRHWIS